MLHSVWLTCCVALLILILLRTPTQDASGLQSVTVTSGANKFSSTNSQPIDGVIWTLIIVYLVLSSVTFK